MMILFIAGIRLLGGILLDPFGTDLGDLRVLSYVQSAIDSSRRIILAKKGPVTALQTELELDSLRPDIGQAWSKTIPARSHENFEDLEKEFSGVWRKTPPLYKQSSLASNDVNLRLILDPTHNASDNIV